MIDITTRAFIFGKDNPLVATGNKFTPKIIQTNNIPPSGGFLLLENTDYLLLESGDFIELE